MYTKFVTQIHPIPKPHVILPKYIIAKFLENNKIRYDINSISPPSKTQGFLPFTLDSHPIIYGPKITKLYIQYVRYFKKLIAFIY